MPVELRINVMKIGAIQWIVGIILIFGCSILFTYLFGEWTWNLQSLLGSILGFVIWLLSITMCRRVI